MGAQPGQPGVADRRAVADMNDLREAARSEGFTAQQETPYPLSRPRRGAAARGGGGEGGGSPAQNPAPIPNVDFSPPLSNSFMAIADDGSFIPPDTHGAVGP
ncbi:MAG TPA: hypothetical protein VIH35_01195, partial [Kiritimatiellia bacterium]